MPLSTTDAAAVEGFLRSRRGTRELRDHVVTSLLTYFTATNQLLRNLPTTPPPREDQASGWLEEWRDYAGDAGLTAASDVNNVVRWIQDADSSGDPSSQRAGKAAAVATALVRQGIAIDRAGEMAIASAITTVEQGELTQQCRSVEVVWILYTGQSPGEEARAWFKGQRQSVLGQAGDDPKVDVTLFRQYAKQLSTTTVVTLERALSTLGDPVGMRWLRYYQRVLDMLQQLGYNLAAIMFTKVVGYAKEQTLGDVAREKAFLRHYFFEVHLGKGLPIEKCHETAIAMAASPATLAVRAAAASISTIPNDPYFGNFQPAAAMTNLHLGSSAGAPGLGVLPPGMGVMPGFMGGAPHAFAGAGAPFNYGVPGGAVADGADVSSDEPPCRFCGSDKHGIPGCSAFVAAKKSYQTKLDAQKAKQRADAGGSP